MTSASEECRCGAAECLSKMAVQKISNSPGARVAVVSTLMYSIAFSYQNIRQINVISNKSD